MPQVKVNQAFIASAIQILQAKAAREGTESTDDVRVDGDPVLSLIYGGV